MSQYCPDLTFFFYINHTDYAHEPTFIDCIYCLILKIFFASFKDFVVKKIIALLCFSSLTLIACSNTTPQENSTQDQTSTNQTSTNQTSTNQNTATTPPPTADTAENALDWQGHYKGTLPCADCEGIETQLELKQDKNYELTEKYLGKKNAQVIKSQGTFQFDAKQPSIITLDSNANQRKFFVAENRLEARDLTTGAKIEGPLAEFYILKKTP